MPTSLADHPVTFHISLNVSNLDRSVEFFSNVFAVSPAKRRDDYAKFELQNPPLTLSLEPVSPADRGALNHVGFKLQTAEDLVALQRRMELAGVRSEREEGVECCYARQTKFWLHDPDGTLWEMYVLEEDLDHRGAGQDVEAVMGEPSASRGPAHIASATMGNGADQQSWFHRLGAPLVIPDEFAADSLDEIALQGSFNAAGTAADIGPFLTQVALHLKPGGQVLIHCLTTDRHLEQVPPLPGPASVVEAIPCLDSLLDHLEAAGFESLRLTKYGSRACFTAAGAEMRETKISATKPLPRTEDRLTVVYRGPCAELTLDSGETLRRGRRAEISRSAVEQLKSANLGDELVVIEAATVPVSCTG